MFVINLMMVLGDRMRKQKELFVRQYSMWTEGQLRDWKWMFLASITKGVCIWWGHWGFHLFSKKNTFLVNNNAVKTRRINWPKKKRITASISFGFSLFGDVKDYNYNYNSLRVCVCSLIGQVDQLTLILTFRWLVKGLGSSTFWVYY